MIENLSKPTKSHYTDTGPTRYVSWFLIHPECNATTDQFLILWYDLSPAPTGNRTHKTSWSVPSFPYCRFLQSAGLLTAYSPPGSSIRSPHSGRPQGYDWCRVYLRLSWAESLLTGVERVGRSGGDTFWLRPRALDTCVIVQ